MQAAIDGSELAKHPETSFGDTTKARLASMVHARRSGVVGLIVGVLAVVWKRRSTPSCVFGCLGLVLVMRLAVEGAIPLCVAHVGAD